MKQINNENSNTEKENKQSAGSNRKILKTISITSAVLFVIVAILFNLVFDTFLGSRLRWDWSQTNMFSIGDITKELLSDLDHEITITGLYERGSVGSYADVELLLEEYQNNSRGMLTVDYVDPVRTPSILRLLDPENMHELSEGSFVVRSEQNNKIKVLGIADFFSFTTDQNFQQQITGITAEQAISGAIRFVLAEETPVVYLTRGHGEADYEANFNILASVLRDNNFLLQELDLLAGSPVPDDAKLLIMLSPQTDISTAARDQIDQYLRRGRSLLVMTEYNTTSFPVLNSLLTDYNIDITDDRVREGDRNRRFQDDPYIFLADAPVSFITEENREAQTFLRNPRHIAEIRNEREWIDILPVFQTGPSGITERGGDPEDTSPEGVITIGMATEHRGFVDGTTVTEPSRVMVMGASGFMGDNILNLFGGQTYNIRAFYNSVNWLVPTDDDSLLIGPRQLPSYRLTNINNTSIWVTTIITVILIPLGLLITALVVYRKRKNL